MVRPSFTYVLLRGLPLSLLVQNHQHLGLQRMRPVHRSRHEITVRTRMPEPNTVKNARKQDVSWPPPRMQVGWERVGNCRVHARS